MSRLLAPVSAVMIFCVSQNAAAAKVTVLPLTARLPDRDRSPVSLIEARHIQRLVADLLTTDSCRLSKYGPTMIERIQGVDIDNRDQRQLLAPLKTALELIYEKRQDAPDLVDLALIDVAQRARKAVDTTLNPFVSPEELQAARFELRELSGLAEVYRPDLRNHLVLASQIAVERARNAAKNIDDAAVRIAENLGLPSINLHYFPPTHLISGNAHEIRDGYFLVRSQASSASIDPGRTHVYIDDHARTLKIVVGPSEFPGEAGNADATKSESTIVSLLSQLRRLQVAQSRLPFDMSNVNYEIGEIAELCRFLWISADQLITLDQVDVFHSGSKGWSGNKIIDDYENGLRRIEKILISPLVWPRQYGARDALHSYFHNARAVASFWDRLMDKGFDVPKSPANRLGWLKLRNEAALRSAAPNLR